MIQNVVVSDLHLVTHLSFKYACSDEDQKVLCQLLGQLQLTPELDTRTILKINILLEHHEEVRFFFSLLLDKVCSSLLVVSSNVRSTVLFSTRS